MTCDAPRTGRRCGYCESGMPHPDDPVTEEAADEMRAAIADLRQQLIETRSAVRLLASCIYTICGDDDVRKLMLET